VCVLRFTESEELTQEVNGRYSGSATDLTCVVQFVYEDKLQDSADLQDALASEFEIGITQDLHEIKATLPGLQTALVHTGEYV